MGTAIKHPVPDQVKQSFVIFHIRALWRSPHLQRHRSRSTLSQFQHETLNYFYILPVARTIDNCNCTTNLDFRTVCRPIWRRLGSLHLYGQFRCSL